MPTVTRREFLNSPKAPLPVAQLVKEAALTPAAVQQADRDQNGRIEGRAELGALWDAGISKGDTFERTQVVKPAFSFAQPVASPEARRLAAVDHAAMVAAVPASYPKIRATLEAEGKLSMQPQCRSFFVPAQTQPARAMVMLLHGFSAGTWQYEEYAQRFAKQGYEGQVAAATSPQARVSATCSLRVHVSPSLQQRLSQLHVTSFAARATRPRPFSAAPASLSTSTGARMPRSG
jgi:hypothetical protein